MLKKIYESIMEFILENKKEIIFFLSFYILMTYPLPYYILVSGGTIDVSDRVEIEEEYEQKGSFNLSYVNEYFLVMLCLTGLYTKNQHIH